jgi:hypothetical protein
MFLVDYKASIRLILSFLGVAAGAIVGVQIVQPDILEPLIDTGEEVFNDFIGDITQSGKEAIDFEKFVASIGTAATNGTFANILDPNEIGNFLQVALNPITASGNLGEVAKNLQEGINALISDSNSAFNAFLTENNLDPAKLTSKLPDISSNFVNAVHAQAMQGIYMMASPTPLIIGGIAGLVAGKYVGDELAR